MHSLFFASKEIYALSAGSFDPTVMPLVNYWGFGFTEKRAVTKVDSAKIDSMNAFVGMDLIHDSLLLDSNTLILKFHPNVQLDFSGIAKGYAADIILDYAQAMGVKDILIEIGGDGLAYGQAEGKRDWKFGVKLT